MARKRDIYQSDAVFVSTTATGRQFHEDGPGDGNYVKELTRVQSVGHSVQVTRQDINQMGQLGTVGREIVEAPTVSVDINYLVTNGGNESKLGLTINGETSAISGILNGSTDEKNVYILIAPEGENAINNPKIGDGNNDQDFFTLAIGNAFLSNYSIDAAVGQVPNASVTLDALNLIGHRGTSGQYVPAIIPESGIQFTGYTYVLPMPTGSTAGEVAALRPGDIELVLDSPFGPRMSGEGSAHIQSFSLSVPIGREPQERMGSKYAFTRNISFPVTVTLNVTADVSDYKSGALQDLVCNDVGYNLAAVMREPVCGVGQGPVAFRAELRGAYLDSINESASIGPNRTVDLSFSTQINGPTELTQGLFLSGSYIHYNS